MRVWWIAALLIATAMAGCTSGDEATPQEAPGPLAQPEEVGLEPQSNEPQSASGATSNNGAEEEPNVEGPTTSKAPTQSAGKGAPAPQPPQPIPGGTMLATVSQEFPVAGYTLEIPEGTAKPWTEGSSILDLDIAVAPVGDLPDAMSIMFYDLDDGQLIQGTTFTPVEGEVYLTAALADPYDNSAVFAPSMLSLNPDYDGKTIGVVIGATGLQGSAGFLIRPDPEYDWREDEVRDVDFLQSKGVWTPWAIGTGSKHSFGYYSEIMVGLFVPVGVIGATMYAGEPLLTSTGPWVMPHGGQRDATLQTPTTLGGYTYAGVVSISGEGAMEWTVEASAGEHTYADDGVLVWADGYGYIATALLFGLPIATAEGDGDVSLKHTQTTASTGELYLLSGAYVSFDADLETLLGVQANPGIVGLEGLVRAMDDWDTPNTFTSDKANLRFAPHIDLGPLCDGC